MGNDADRFRWHWLHGVSAEINVSAAARLKADLGWKRPFDEPIPLPRGRQLVTLEDAGNYITKLPKAELEAPEWQAAMQALILAATRGGPTMLARIGVMRALNRRVERVFNPDRKDHHWGSGKYCESGGNFWNIQHCRRTRERPPGSCCYKFCRHWFHEPGLATILLGWHSDNELNYI
jgi:hypothetical protein